MVNPHTARFVATVLAIGAIPSAAAADEAVSSVVVLLASTQSPGALDPLLLGIRAQVSDLPVSLVMEEVTELPPSLPDQVALASRLALRDSAVAVFWLDLFRPGRLFIYLAEPGGSRVLVRAVEASTGVAGIEAVAVIVRGLVQAIIEGGTIGVQPASTHMTATAAPGPPLPAMTPSPSPSMPWLSVQLALALDFRFKQAPVQAGLDAGLLLSPHENWTIFADYRLLTGAQTPSADIDLEVSRHPMTVGVRVQWPFGAWDIGASLFGVLDYVTEEAVVHSSRLTVTKSDAVWLGGVGLLAHGSWRATPVLRLFVNAGLEVYTSTLEYVVELSGGPAVLLSSLPVCPRILVGVSLDVI
jgi:hypothetical protein